MEGPSTVESGVQLFSRISPNTSCLNGIHPKLIKNGGPFPKQVIEVTGECSNDLLLDFLIRCILCKDFNEQWRDSAAIFINTEHHISLLKITKVLDAHLKLVNIKNRKPIIEAALRNIVIINCYDKEQFQLTLRNLEKVVQDQDNSHLLVVDNISAYYWIATQNKKLSFDCYSNNNFALLKKVINNLNLILVFSRYQIGDLNNRLNLHVDYKIIGEKSSDGNYQFNVINFENESSCIVPFTVQTHITF